LRRRICLRGSLRISGHYLVWRWLLRSRLRHRLISLRRNQLRSRRR
jgi:hypothetical protein